MATKKSESHVCKNTNPAVWGPHVWFILEMTVSQLEPENETLTNHILMQFVSLMETIPCENCRVHYNNFVQENPIENALQSKTSLARWIYNCKTSVNRRISKPNIPFVRYLATLNQKFDCNF